MKSFQIMIVQQGLMEEVKMAQKCRRKMQHIAHMRTLPNLYYSTIREYTTFNEGQSNFLRCLVIQIHRNSLIRLTPMIARVVQ